MLLQMIMGILFARVWCGKGGDISVEPAGIDSGLYKSMNTACSTPLHFKKNNMSACVSPGCRYGHQVSFTKVNKKVYILQFPSLFTPLN